MVNRMKAGMPWSVVVLALLSSSVPAQTWTEFRGPNGSGIGNGTGLAAEWTREMISWRTPLPGRGWSSPVLSDNQIWLTTAIETYRDGKPQSLANGYLAPADQVSLNAVCIDSNDGRIVHQVELFRIDQAPILHSHNTYASPTPVLDEDTAYFHFGTMGTAAVDRTSGSVNWKNRDFVFDHETGPGSSPVLWRDLLIFHCDGTDQQFIAAVNKSDGSEVWRRDRSGELHPEGMMKKAFSTPTLAQLDGRELLLSVGANWLYAYDPATGVEQWKVPYGQLGFSNVPRPVIREGIIYVCTGFTRAQLMAIDLKKAGQDPSSAIAWVHKTQVPNIPSPLVVDGLLFMVGDRGIATCLDAATGVVHWQERLGGDFAASPVCADGKVYFCSKAGKVSVVAAARDFKLIATNEMDHEIWATPAIIDGQIYLRTDRELLRIDSVSVR